ncbi:MAG TPA: type II toxin-antitoxin system VapC family toxin [Terriglobales bacterium]|nr:type II toxin-antitoxin system VapC family toxin [Terriglobales bacterium]
MILADSDVLIDYLRDVQPIAGHVMRHREANNLQTTSINCFELLSGAWEGKHGDRVRTLVATIPVISLDKPAAIRAVFVRQAMEQKGFAIAMADSLIAGIALENDLPLLTRNRRHFEKIDGLRIVDFS